MMVNRIKAQSATCDIKSFAATLSGLLADPVYECDERVAKAVRQSVRKTAKELRSGAYGNAGKHVWSDKYMDGFSSHSEARKSQANGEVGNKGKPGLVHLLEKGHATLTGRRTQAYPHMEPAFDAMVDDFMERAEKAIGEALR